jgi:TP901 family phage tail tape measure protein
MAIKPVEILITAKDKASAVFGSLRATAIAAGVAIAGYFGFRAFAGAIEGAAELEAKLSEVKAVAGATADDMVLLRKAAEDAGASTKFTATEAADALGNLARAGLSVRDSIAALPSTLQLAQAGQVSLARAAEIVTRTLAGFSLAATESARIADVLAKGANASNTSVEGLAQALSYAAPTAKALNIPLETTVALLGKFADGGIDASRGGTALNAILSQFLDPASKFRTELAAAGITTNDFEQALRQLAAAGPAGQKAILAVGTEAGPALRALLNQGIDAFDNLKRQLAEATGSAATFAAEVENNLTGATLGLGSAWDALKVKLATPVLPVLKDGIQQLTGALREAVANGTVGKFGDAIAQGFRSALTWARSFLAEVDFDALAARVSAAAERVNAAFVTVETYAKNTGNSVQLVWGVMAAGANGVLVGIYAIGTAFAATTAGIVKGAALASEALAKIAITDGAKQKLLGDAAAMREVLAGLTGVTQEFAVKAVEAMDGVATNAQLARDGWAGLADTTDSASERAQTAIRVYDGLAETLKEVGGDATATGQKMTAAALLHTEAARKTRAEVEALKVEYEAALQAGDVQSALTKLQQMQDALKKTAKFADDMAIEVDQAFDRVGIKSKDSLELVAVNAARDFKLIETSGKATAEGLQIAFRRYAEAAIAANDGQATASLKADAKMRGLEITTDSTGKTIVRAMNEAKKATDGAGDSANRAADGYRNMAQSADQAAAAAARAAKYGRPGEGSKQKGNETSYDPGRGSPYASPRDRGPLNGDGQNQAEFQRMEKLKGQNAVDNTLQYKLREKLNAGTLGPEDEAEIRAVIDALRQQETVNRDLDSFGGAFSAAGSADRAEWANVRAMLEQSLNKQAIGRTVNVKIDTGSGTETVATDEAGAQALVRGLQKAGLAAGR